MVSVSTSKNVKNPNRISPSLPFPPLWEAAKSKARVNPLMSTGFTTSMFCDMVGFDERAVARWSESGTVPWISADCAATKLGYHPLLIWQDQWLNVKGDFDVISSGKRDGAINTSLESDEILAHIRGDECEACKRERSVA
jgi:hypothetical protein